MAGAGGSGGESQTVLLCRVATRLIALPNAAIAGVDAIPPLWRPPTTPPVVAGFIGLRGAAMPVLHAARLLGLDEGSVPDLYAHVVRLRGAADRTIGLLVDRAEDVVAVAETALHPLDAGETLNGCAAAAFDVAGTPAHLIDPARLLQAAEREALAELTAAAERRAGEWQGLVA